MESGINFLRLVTEIGSAVLISATGFHTEFLSSTMTTRSFSLFFYGTLMSPDVLHRVIYGLSAAPPSSKLIIRSAILHVNLLIDKS